MLLQKSILKRGINGICLEHYVNFDIIAGSMKYNDLFLQAGMSDPLAIVYRGTLCHHEWQFVRTLASIFWINCETFLLFSSPKIYCFANKHMLWWIWKVNRLGYLT